MNTRQQKHCNCGKCRYGYISTSAVISSQGEFGRLINLVLNKKGEYTLAGSKAKKTEKLQVSLTNKIAKCGISISSDEIDQSKYIDYVNADGHKHRVYFIRLMRTIHPIQFKQFSAAVISADFAMAQNPGFPEKIRDNDGTFQKLHQRVIVPIKDCLNGQMKNLI